MINCWLKRVGDYGILAKAVDIGVAIIKYCHNAGFIFYQIEYFNRMTNVMRANFPKLVLIQSVVEFGFLVQCDAIPRVLQQGHVLRAVMQERR